MESRIVFRYRRSRSRTVSIRVLLAALAIGAISCAPSTRDDEEPPRIAGDSAAVAARPPLIAKVEHFYATAPDAERLFAFFRDTLGLVPVWPYRDYGGFASGAVSLGNVAFEFVRWVPEDGTRLPTEFSGIAFEPVGNTDAALAALARRGVAHTAPDSSTSVGAGGRTVGWVNTNLQGLIPPAEGVFLCDYVERARIAQGRAAASAALHSANGGPLGVQALQEIVVGVTDLEAALVQWRKLVDAPAQESAGVFSFGAGPRVRVVRAAAPGIHRILIRVRSLDAARAFLAGRGLLAAEGQGVAIAPAAIGGLDVRLTER
jgi:catechol 2,3-dioxygenase-like lactoylglutathione lyase family enzyme